MSARPNDAPRIRIYISVYTRTSRYVCGVHELHISDKHTPRRRHRYCPLWRGPPPPGNNSKSRVINPSAAPCLPSLPPFILLSARAVGVHACAYGCLCVASSPSPVHPSLFVFPTSFSFTRACTYAHARREGHAISIRSLLFGMGYTCMTCIVVNCSHATAMYLPG